MEADAGSKEEKAAIDDHHDGASDESCGGGDHGRLVWVVVCDHNFHGGGGVSS